jgi:hypothetical protein
VFIKLEILYFSILLCVCLCVRVCVFGIYLFYFVTTTRCMDIPYSCHLLHYVSSLSFGVLSGLEFKHIFNENICVIFISLCRAVFNGVHSA